MKKAVLILALAALFFTCTAASATQFGPFTPAAQEENVAVGLGYFYFSDKWEAEDSGWEDIKLKQHRVYLQAAYGFMEDWEVYLRIGGADMKADDVFTLGESEFDGDMKPFGTVGLRGAMEITPAISIGPFVQISRYSDYDDKRSSSFTLLSDLSDPALGVILPAGTYTVSEQLDIKDAWDVSAGVGIQGNIGKATLYAGPFLYWSRAEVEETLILTGPLSGTLRASTDYESKSNIGGFAGVRIPLARGLLLDAEAQLRSEFSAGLSLTYAFGARGRK